MKWINKKKPNGKFSVLNGIFSKITFEAEIKLTLRGDAV